MQKRIGANIFRKGRLILLALIVGAFAVLLYSSVRSGDSTTPLMGGGITNATLLWILLGIVAVCAFIVIYGILAIVRNRILLDEEGIHVRTLTKSYSIPRTDILRIEEVRENVRGGAGSMVQAAMLSRTTFKVITDRKTYELSSREFGRLSVKFKDWYQTQKTTVEEGILK